MFGSVNGVQAGIIGLSLAGGGIGLGGLFAYLMLFAHRRLLPVVITAAAGMMLILLFFDLLPESIDSGGIFLSAFCIAIGYFFANKIERLTNRVIIITNNPQKDVFLRTSILLALAVSLHNFPTGIALGTSLLDKPSIAYHIVTAMTLHGLPEGFILGFPLVLSNIRPFVFLIVASIVGIPTGIGAFWGYYIGNIAPWTLTFMLGMAIGTMIHVTCFDILKFAWEKSEAKERVIGLTVGIVLGFILLSMI